MGINDIPTTDPWMIPFFQGGKEEASLYTSGSSKRIHPICPDCGRVKKKTLTISKIKSSGNIGCNCSNSNSYPNKFIFNMLDQLHIDFEPEKVFKWAKFARYDFYFVSPIDKKEYIIEADGGLGHGNCTFERTDFSRIESLYVDYRKEKIAMKHNIEVIRIDCIKSEKEYIVNNIMKSKLDHIVNLDLVNWDLCNEYATKNIVKEVCNKYNCGVNIKELATEYKLFKGTIIKYIIRGEELGWCIYKERRKF
jgi:hypothetical protein